MFLGRKLTFFHVLEPKIKKKKKKNPNQETEIIISLPDSFLYVHFRRR
jgi:hypothetical protein